MKKLVLVFLISAAVAGSAWSGKNAGGALVVHVDDVNVWSAGAPDPVDPCRQFENWVPQECQLLATRTNEDYWPVRIWFIAAMHPGSAPGVALVYFGNDHNLPEDSHLAWDFCGPDATLEIPDNGWPEDPLHAGNSIAYAYPIVGEHFFPVYYFEVLGSEGSYYGTGINPFGGYASFIDDGNPPVQDYIEGFGRVYWNSDEGWNDCPGLPLFEHSQELTGVVRSDAAWGDFDNDGDPDLAISGWAESGDVTLTYENVAGTLTLRANDLLGVRNQGSGNLAWGDYDNDGDLDLAVAGMYDAGELSTRIYRNDGNGNLEWDSEQSLMGVKFASVAWGDVDNDGDLDLVVMGNNGHKARTRLYKNHPLGTLTMSMEVDLAGLQYGSADWADWDGDGDLDLLITSSGGAFVGRKAIFYENDPVGTLSDDGDHGLPALAFSDVAWGDYDSDGDLDLAITGQTDDEEIARIYQNDGDGNLTQATGDLMSVYRSSCAWGDYDNDGDLDVAFCGDGGEDHYTRLYENLDGVFLEADFDAPGVYEGSLGWADVEGDGDLDLFLTGADASYNRYASLYRQTNSRWGGRGANTPPTPPTNLTCQAPHTRLNLSWDAGTDAETPQPGLCYTLRVGTFPGGNNIASGTNATPFMGNVGQAISRTLHVPPGTYYWSVQTIDSGFMVSDWSEEQVCEVFGGDDYADHNVGNCTLTMTDQGILGFMDASQTEGSGFVYPADGVNHLYIGSLWVGESTTHVANRDYAQDPAQEWIVSSDPDGHVWTTTNGYSDQDIVTSYTDAGAADPSGLFVHQESWAFEDPDPATDLVMVRYTFRNEGDQALNDLYVGVFLDIDIAPALQNRGGTDNDRNLVYMTDESGIHIGLQLLQDEGGYPQLANLTLIDNETYVYPNHYVLDEDKYEFLSAADPDHILSEAPEPGDYGVLASVGPINMLIGEQHDIRFAILGGEDLVGLQRNADAARLIQQQGIADAPPKEVDLRGVRLLASIPNPFAQTTQVRFELDRESDVHLGVYDVQGRLVRVLAQGPYSAERHTLAWDGRDDVGRAVTGGIYFLRLDSSAGSESTRLIHLK